MPDPSSRPDDTKLDELLALARDRARNDEVQQRALDALYEELKQYKEDFIFQAEKPFLLDLLLFYDSLNWFHQSLQRREMSPDVVSDSFQYLLDEFLELLYRRDVVPAEGSEKFDRKLHKAVRVTPAANAGDDWKIEAVLKRGFIRNEKVLRAEEVSVYRHSSDGSISGSVGMSASPGSANSNSEGGPDRD